MTTTVLARLVTLKTMPISDLKQQWREFFDKEPPPFNRRYLESRLSYRIQELAYGGLKPETIKRLEALAEDIGASNPARPPGRFKSIPVAGTQLVREWQGTEHRVTVRDDGAFEYQGQPFRSLSAIARAITGTRWNGWVFFGMKNQRDVS